MLKLLCLCIAVSIFCSSCKKESITVGFLLPHMTIKRYPMERDVFTSKIHELGGEVKFMSADNDEAKQTEQVKELLKENVDILVLDPVNRFRAAEMVRGAHKKGIKVISYDRLIANSDVDVFMTFDAYAIGRQMTQYALDKKPKGDYFIMGGDKTDMNAVMINESIEKTLASSVQSGNVKVVYRTFIEKYTTEDAENEMIRYLKLSQNAPDVVLASSDMLALGTLNALKKFGLDGKVLITGQGGEVFACKNILKGQQTMTIYKPVKKMAVLAAELSMKIAKGENVDEFFKNKLFNGKKEISSTLLEVISVDATNLKSTIVTDGMVTEDELSR
jgi:D-xylose transport system substrate-binding protein